MTANLPLALGDERRIHPRDETALLGKKTFDGTLTMENRGDDWLKLLFINEVKL